MVLPLSGPGAARASGTLTLSAAERDDLESGRALLQRAHPAAPPRRRPRADRLAGGRGAVAHWVGALAFGRRRATRASIRACCPSWPRNAVRRASGRSCSSPPTLRSFCTRYALTRCAFCGATSPVSPRCSASPTCSACPNSCAQVRILVPSGWKDTSASAIRWWTRDRPLGPPPRARDRWRNTWFLRVALCPAPCGPTGLARRLRWFVMAPGRYGAPPIRCRTTAANRSRSSRWWATTSSTTARSTAS